MCLTGKETGSLRTKKKASAEAEAFRETQLLAGDHVAELSAGREAPDQILSIGTVDVADDLARSIQARDRLLVHVQNLQLVVDVHAAQRGGKAGRSQARSTDPRRKAPR